MLFIHLSRFVPARRLLRRPAIFDVFRLVVGRFVFGGGPLLEIRDFTDFFTFNMERRPSEVPAIFATIRTGRRGLAICGFSFVSIDLLKNRFNVSRIERVLMNSFLITKFSGRIGSANFGLVHFWRPTHGFGVIDSFISFSTKKNSENL